MTQPDMPPYATGTNRLVSGPAPRMSRLPCGMVRRTFASSFGSWSRLRGTPAATTQLVQLCASAAGGVWITENARALRTTTTRRTLPDGHVARDIMAPLYEDTGIGLPPSSWT